MDQTPPASPRDQEIENALQTAIALCGQGDLVPAERLCRNILVVAPGHGGAFNVLGAVAGQLGLKRHAMRYFEEAMRDPFTAQMAKANFARAKAMASPEIFSSPRYLVIKAWGAGFWADVGSVLGALLLADITRRIPVVHWGKASKFGEGADSENAGNAFRLYFEPVSHMTLAELAAQPSASFFPPKWSEANLARDTVAKYLGEGSLMGGILFLNRPETVAVSDYYTGVVDLAPWIGSDHPWSGLGVDELIFRVAARYLKPLPAILAKVERFREQHLKGRPAIAVHVRGSDKKDEIIGLDALNRSYFAHLDAAPSGHKFFLLTDDARWARAFRERYGERVAMTDCLRTEDDTPPHAPHNRDRVRLGTEVIVDFYTALSCDRFIGNGRSNVSALIAGVKRWPAGACTLVFPSQLHERDLTIFTPAFAERLAAMEAAS